VRDHNDTRLSGHLTADPRPFTTDTGEGCEFTLAVGDQWRDKDKQLQERTDFIGVVCYGPVRERAMRLAKGDRILITGKLRNETVPKPDGKTETKTKLRAATLETLRNIVL
jgi:single stranded DNA-binding protein